MYTATVTAKGQVTIPVEVRKALNLKPGSKIMLFQDSDGDFVLRARSGSIMDLRGCLAGLDLPKSDEEMNGLIHRHALELDEAAKGNPRKLSGGEAA